MFVNFDQYNSDSVDQKIIEERNAELKKIELELKDIQGLFNDFQPLFQQQGEELQQVEEKAVKVEIQTEEAVKDQEIYSNWLNKKKIIKLACEGGGAAIGGVIGTVGFIANPILGIVTVATFTAAGFGTGYGIGKIVT